MASDTLLSPRGYRRGDINFGNELGEAFADMGLKEDLLDESPGLPEPGLAVIWRQGAREVPHGPQARRHTEEAARDGQLQRARLRCEAQGGHQQGGGGQTQREPRPAVGAFDDVLQALPGG